MLSGVARGFLNSVAGHESGGGADLAALEARIDASTPDPLPFYKWKSAVILDPIQGSGSGSTLVAKLPLSQVCKWMTLQVSKLYRSFPFYHHRRY